MSTIMHLDMDAFFASVEQRNNPYLRGKPVIVGSQSRRGVVSTCSYEARKFGVHSAMPSREAMKLCPHALWMKGDFDLYFTASSKVISILEKYSPLVEVVSIDEAFVDLSGMEKSYVSPVELAIAIKKEICREVGLTCTIGIAPNRFLAKMASGLNKPDGLTLVEKNNIPDLIYPLPVDNLLGIGPVTNSLLEKAGFHTIGDLMRLKPETLKLLLGEEMVLITELVAGKEDTITLDDIFEDEKSISHEHTLSKDISDPEALNSLILTLADKVVQRMLKRKWLARTITLKVRFASFMTITRAKSLTIPTNDLNQIFFMTKSLLPKKEASHGKVRLIGVKVSELHRLEEGLQEDFFELARCLKADRLAQVTMKIRDKYGADILARAGSLLRPQC